MTHLQQLARLMKDPTVEILIFAYPEGVPSQILIETHDSSMKLLYNPKDKHTPFIAVVGDKFNLDYEFLGMDYEQCQQLADMIADLPYLNRVKDLLHKLELDKIKPNSLAGRNLLARVLRCTFDFKKDGS